MKRALYVDGGRPPSVVVLDGPALRISRDGRADARAPLRLLSRVVVHGAVNWQTRALLACMDAAVPVAFVATDGSTRGWCLGAGQADDDINDLLEDCILRDDWPGRHEDWLRGMERRAMLACLRNTNVTLTTLRPADVSEALEARLDRLRAPVETVLIVSTLCGALDAHIADLLRRAGVSARFIAGHGAGVSLVVDFRRLLKWTLWPSAERAVLYFCRHGAKSGRRDDSRRRLVRQYEATAPRVEASFRDLFRRFRQVLQDMLA